MASTREEALTHAKAMEDHLSQSSAGPSGMQLDDQDEDGGACAGGEGGEDRGIEACQTLEGLVEEVATTCIRWGMK